MKDRGMKCDLCGKIDRIVGCISRSLQTDHLIKEYGGNGYAINK